MKFVLKMNLIKLTRQSCHAGFANRSNLLYRSFATKSRTKHESKGLRWMALIGIGGGAVVGVGYSLSKFGNGNGKTSAGVPIEEKCWRLDALPNVKESKKVLRECDNTGLEIWLYQYQTCPFCCKVRAFLDFYGLSYHLVEVNPVLRKEISWSDWRKVPVLLVKYKEGIQQLNDSSMITSVLGTFLANRQFDFSKVDKYYPVHPTVSKQGKNVLEVQNKYFIMYEDDDKLETNKQKYAEERKWRKWVDDVLVHTISPNVYRTPSESLQAFNWFSEVGEWKQHFSSWERLVVIYVGAAAMYFVGKRLKSRYNLEKDVRISLYTECNRWARHVKKNGEFGGGDAPDLSDLAVFGVLKSMEGCDAWKDVLANTEIGPWFSRMTFRMQQPDNRP